MKYPLQQEQGYFWTGMAGDDRQVIIASTVTDIYVFSFARDGHYAGMEKTPLRNPPERDLTSGIYRIGNAYYRDVELQIDEIKRRLQCRACDILIEGFEEPEAFAGIDPLPGDYQQFIESPQTVKEDDREFLERAVREWRERGWFVFVFWGEYWMSAEGRVMFHG
jgi:hypothetical protein